jgi:hypothetical protein
LLRWVMTLRNPIKLGLALPNNHGSIMSVFSDIDTYLTTTSSKLPLMFQRSAR